MRFSTMFLYLCAVLSVYLAAAVPAVCAEDSLSTSQQFRAGAVAVDITPARFPIVVNGGFQPRYAQQAHDPLHARSLVLDDGRTQIAIVVVDSCVMDRPICDAAKQMAQQQTGIPSNRVFISATHTHSAPAVVGALGTDPDEHYREFLIAKIAESIQSAKDNLAVAQIGWAVGSLPGVSQSRRWIARPDKIQEDPFGEFTTRATMHPGYRNPDWQEASGPMNPDVPVIAVRRPDGGPIALLSNFSIHYVGAQALSADYFGIFAGRIGELIGAADSEPPFVGMLSNGVSGDAYLKDYSREQPEKFDMHSIAETVAKEAAAAYRRIEWKDWMPLTVTQEELELAVRPARLEWGKRIMDQIRKEDRSLKGRTDFYAREQLLLAELPKTRKLKLQAVRIGTLAMVGIPCEVFGITGLRIRDASPFDYTFTVMLANGWDGYLPPPEQMAMGGYTTWLARSSCLEPQAEPKIRARVARLLDDAADGYRRPVKPVQPSPYASAVLESKPTVYWRLDDLEGPQALNAVGGKRLGEFETQIAYSMPGPRSPAFAGFEAENLAPHFVGQRLVARIPDLGSCYTVELWFYSCMPTDARSVTGYLFARGPSTAEAPADLLAIGGQDNSPGKLLVQSGGDVPTQLPGVTDIPLRNWVPRQSWHHVVMVRDETYVTVYLDGRVQPEISGETGSPCDADAFFIGGRSDGRFGFEGRIDEVALYSRAFSADEARKHYWAAIGSQ